jgi:hypothetical protein
MTILSRIAEATLPGLPLTPETELAEALDEIARICELPFWVEDATGRMPSDAQLLSWQTLGEVLHWAGEAWPEPAPLQTEEQAA